MAKIPVNQQNALPGQTSPGAVSTDTVVVFSPSLGTFSVQAIQWIAFNTNAPGFTTVVPAPANGFIRVLSVDFVCDAAESVGWGTGSFIRDPQSFAANSGMVRDLVYPYFVQTQNNADALQIFLTNGANVTGALGYVIVPA